MKKAIIFDLNGTLWDSTGCACAIWNRVLDQHKEATFHIKQEQVAKLMGKTMTEIGDILFPELSKKTVKLFWMILQMKKFNTYLRMELFFMMK